MDTLPCLRKQNEIAATGRYGTEKFPALLPEMQAESLIDAKDLQVSVIKGFGAKIHS